MFRCVIIREVPNIPEFSTPELSLLSGKIYILRLDGVWNKAPDYTDMWLSHKQKYL